MPDPSVEGSGVIAYADLSPGRDPALVNQIGRFLHDVSLNLMT